MKTHCSRRHSGAKSRINAHCPSAGRTRDLAKDLPLFHHQKLHLASGKTGHILRTPQQREWIVIHIPRRNRDAHAIVLRMICISSRKHPHDMADLCKHPHERPSEAATTLSKQVDNTFSAGIPSSHETSQRSGRAYCTGRGIRPLHLRPNKITVRSPYPSCQGTRAQTSVPQYVCHAGILERTQAR